MDAERRLAALGQKNNVLVQPLLPPVLPPAGFAQAEFPGIGATGVATVIQSEPLPFSPQSAAAAPPGASDNGQYFTNLAPPPGILVPPGGFNRY